MPRLTLHTKKYGDQTFFIKDDACRSRPRYIHLEDKSKDLYGFLGTPICENGNMSGVKIKTTLDRFEREVKKWHKAHLAAIAEYGCNYGD